MNENIKNISFENSLNTPPEILKETSKRNNNLDKKILNLGLKIYFLI